MPNFKVNNTDYYYALHGDAKKPALVLISGLWSDHSYWLPLLPKLTHDFHVLIFDNRAIGQTSDDDCSQNFTLENMASDTACLIKHIFPQQRVNLIGQSMGGAISQIIAAQNPTIINKLMLFNSTLKWSRATIEGMRSLLLAAKENTSFEQAFSAYLAWIFGEEFITDKAKVTALRNKLLSSESIQTIADQERQFDALAAFKGIDLNAIQCSTFIGYGPEDKICAISEAHVLAENIPNAELYQFAGAHSPLLEDFDNVVDVIKRFLWE